MSKAFGPDGIVTVWEFIDKATAEKHLAHNLPNNRRFMPSVSAKYERDMMDGTWLATHEGVAFDEDEYLVDGQHRLSSIVASGKPQWMLVTRGLSKKAAEVINRGKMRNLAHALQVAGYEHTGYRLIAAARIMYHGTTNNNAGGLKTAESQVTDQMMKDFINKHLEALVFALGCIHTSVGSAIIVGVVARAYYHTDTEKLTRFALAMQDKIPLEDAKPGDRSARQLYTYLKSVKGGAVSARAVTYRKAQNALHAYLNDQPLSKLYENSEDLFPLPK